MGTNEEANKTVKDGSVNWQQVFMKQAYRNLSQDTTSA
jgi:hypothetical protein